LGNKIKIKIKIKIEGGSGGKKMWLKKYTHVRRRILFNAHHPL
jgi:hypothetical protein